MIFNNQHIYLWLQAFVPFVMFVQIIINLEIGHAFEVNYPPPKKK